MGNSFVRTAARVTAALALLAVPFVSAGSAEAATGGCNPHIKVAGFDIGVCISNRGSANPTFVYSDIYVNNVPTGPFSCTIYVEQWDGGTKVFQDDGHSCAKGHYDAMHDKKIIDSEVVGCRHLHSSSWMTLNGTFVRIGDSSTYQFGDSC